MVAVKLLSCKVYGEAEEGEGEEEGEGTSDILEGKVNRWLKANASRIKKVQDVKVAANDEALYAVVIYEIK